MDLRHGVRSIRVPTLVVVGDRDRLTPKTSAQALLRNLPHARGAVLTGAGHIAMMERHAAFDRLLDGFLAETFEGRAARPPRSSRVRTTA